MLRIRGDAVESRWVDGQIVLLDGARQQFLQVNHAGATLWPRLVEGATLEELVGCLQGRYGLDEAAARDDVASFIASLRDLGLLDQE